MSESRIKLIMDPWSKPKHSIPFQLSQEDIASLTEIGLLLRPVVRIGFKDKVSTQVVTKTNRHLASDQIIKVEFVKLKNQEIRTCSKILAENTASQLLSIHGSFAIFFRKNPNTSLDELYNKFSF